MEHTDLHPNWRALATVHFPMKVFVTEGAPAAQERPKRHYEISNISGTEARKFYEETLKADHPRERPRRKPPSKRPPTAEVPRKQAFDKNKFFRAAMANDIRTLQGFDYREGDVDEIDAFGWTALMMAACEGAIESVCYLLEIGADFTKTDGKGNSVCSLAEKKGYLDIVNIVQNMGKCSESSDDGESSKAPNRQPFFCKICDRNFKEASLKEHKTSTLHRFNVKTEHTFKRRFNPPEENRGLKLMLKQGWDRHSGLGPTNTGQLYPIKTVIRKQRTGLGIKQNEPKVTHFQPYDLAAVKYRPPPRAKTRNELKRDQRRERRKEMLYRRELS